MAKDNEKKVSENMSSEELENVAGGWCMAGGKSAPKEVKSVKKADLGHGYYSITTTFSDGSYISSYFNSIGRMIGIDGSIDD